MATTNKRSLLILAFCAFILATGIIACKKDDNNNTPPAEDIVYTLSGNASGDQEAPTRVTTSSATGTITGTYNRTTNLLTYTINYSGLTSNTTNMHFHGPADPGKAAGVAIAITGFPTATSATVSGTATLTDAQEADLLAFKYYYNVHSSNFPGGEIRGQVFLLR